MEKNEIVLFDRGQKTIRKHINNIFLEEELERDNNTQKLRVDGVKQKVPFNYTYFHRNQVVSKLDF